MSERNDVTAQVPDTSEDMTDGNVQTFTIDADQAGRADKALCLLMDISRARSRELIDDGRVLLQDTPVKPKTDL